ncbi:MAG: hypothetical protein QXK61_08410, partial [Nitrososphaerota archaeon]
MSGLRIRIPPRFAYDCMMGLLYHIQSPHRLRLEAGEVVIDGPRPANALKDALDTARQILENRMTTMAAVRERTRKPSTSFFERIPRSGNDRRPISALMGAYGLSWNTSAVDFVKTVSAKFATVSENIVLPSLLKPEYYEFNRGPGYIGEEMKKMRYEYPMLTVSLSLIGYLVCRMGRTLVGENDWVSVVVTPQTISHDRPLAIDQQYSLNTYVHSVSQLDRFLSMSRYLFAGIYPETALHLYLVMSMGGAKIRLYAVKEPGGQSPATIFSAMQMDLEPIYKALARYGLNNVK